MEIVEEEGNRDLRSSSRVEGFGWIPAVANDWQRIDAERKVSV